MLAERADGSGTRLALTPALNGALCRRGACDLLCMIPIFLLGEFAFCCWARPNMYYELQDAAHTPLGGARYTVVGHTFCTEVCCLRNLPDGARLDLRH